MEPVTTYFYLHKEIVYKVVNISRSKDCVYLERIDTGELFTENYSLFTIAYKRVLKVTEVARLLGRHPRTIYRYETEGLINKPKCFMDKRGRMVRFYQKQDLIDMYELIASVHAGRPNKNNMIINNSLPDKRIFKERLKEKFE